MSCRLARSILSRLTDGREVSIRDPATSASSSENLRQFESLHNLKYWRREPYFGFGADAHSFDGEWRWAHAESPGDYAASPVAIDRTAADAVAERFFLGLRLTNRGVMLSNEVFADFVGVIALPSI